jgi:hypothetical protein
MDYKWTRTFCCAILLFHIMYTCWLWVFIWTSWMIVHNHWRTFLRIWSQICVWNFTVIIVNMIMCKALDTFKRLTSNGVRWKSAFVSLQGSVYMNARTSSISSIGGGNIL